MVIKVTEVWKTFGEGHTAVHALRDVDLVVPQGEFSVILGPSGSGKTTLLNLVGAIDDATGGRIEVTGVDLANLDVDGKVKFRRESVGFVFQFFNLIPTLTAAENVELVVDLTLGNGAERAAEVRGMKDIGFRPKVLTRMKGVFSDRVVVELPEAKHYIQQDAPEEIVAAIIDRFG